MKYTQVSEPVLCDLLNSKSKVTDMKLLVDEYAKQLKEIDMLEKIVTILYSERYDTNDQDLVKEL